MTALKVVINEAHGLHEGVAGGGPNEGPAPLFEVLAEGGRFLGFSELHGLFEGECTFAGLGLETLKVAMEILEFGEKLKRAVGVIDGGENFAPMADDPDVENEAFDVGVVEFCDFVEVKVGEAGPEVFAFAENGEPGETGLKSFEADLFEEAEIIAASPAPFFVVVAEVFFIIAAPPAAGFSVRAGDEAVFWRVHEKESLRSRERYWMASRT